MFKKDFLYEIEVDACMSDIGIENAGHLFYTYAKSINFCPCCNSGDTEESGILPNLFNRLYNIRSDFPGHRPQNIPVDSWKEWKYSDENCSGTWPKRFDNAFYKAYDFRLPKELVSAMGNEIANALQRTTETIRFEIVDWADWEPGNFQEPSGSCWWDEYDYAREGLINSGGCAVLFYDSKEQYDEAHPLRYESKGLGRCWLFPHEDKLMVFNGYGYYLRDSVRYIAQALELEYRECSFNGGEDEVGWINGECGYVLGKDNLSYNYYLDYAGCSSFCNQCNSEYYTSLDGENLCYKCYLDAVCYHCKCVGDEHTKVNDMNVCNSCLIRHEGYEFCYECDDLFDSDDMRHTLDGHSFCEDCESMLFCSICNNYCENNICDSCAVKAEKALIFKKLISEIKESMSSFDRWKFEYDIVGDYDEKIHRL